jgi:hypothetical protein
MERIGDQRGTKRPLVALEGSRVASYVRFSLVAEESCCRAVAEREYDPRCLIACLASERSPACGKSYGRERGTKERCERRDTRINKILPCMSIPKTKERNES